MGNPFRDSFLKAGLVTKKQVNKAKKEAHQKKGKGAKAEQTDSGVSQKVQEQRAAQQRKQNDLNQKRAEEKRKREHRAQVKQLIEHNRLEQNRDGEAYHFVQDKKIMRIFVSEEMIDQLSSGSLAIVHFAEQYDVVPAKVANQIAERMDNVVVVSNKKS